MFETIFWVVLRSIVIPYVAFMLLRDSFLGEQGALLAVGIALLIVTIISIAWNVLKILGNTLLLKGRRVLLLILKIALQLIALGVIWYHYITVFTDLLK